MTTTAELEPNEIHVWRVDLDGGSPPAGSRRRREVARRALRRVLAGYLELEPDEIRLRRDSHGKPALVGDAGVRFNLSHSDGLALIAVAGREVGIDVEATQRRRDFVRLADRALGTEASAAVRVAAPGARAAVFYAAWVRHEAVAKCLGVGLGRPLPTAPVSVRGLDAGSDHAAAVAISGKSALPLRRFEFVLE
jgi:4'-phosphopantetheinyl transferase